MLGGVEQHQAIEVEARVHQRRHDAIGLRLHGGRDDAGEDRIGVRLVEIDSLSQPGAGGPEDPMEPRYAQGVRRHEVAHGQEFPEVQAATQVLLGSLSPDQIEVGLEMVPVVARDLWDVMGHQGIAGVHVERIV